MTNPATDATYGKLLMQTVCLVLIQLCGLFWDQLLWQDYANVL